MCKAPDDKVSFHYTFKVAKSDIDTLNHVNNLVYLKWVLEAANKHWNSLASDEIKNENLWVVLRHEIDYLKQAFLNDNITVHTWIGDTEGVRSVRHVHICCGESLLVQCKTTWCLVDHKTLRPKRIGADILDLFIKK